MAGGSHGIAIVGLAAISAGCVWFGFRGAVEGWRTRGWVEVPAHVLDVEVVQGSRGSQTVKGSYEYEYDGTRYVGDRLELLRGWDSTRMAQRLHAARKSGQAIAVFVDPLRPSEAVVDRDVGMGTVLMYFGLAAMTGLGALGVWRKRQAAQ